MPKNGWINNYLCRIGRYQGQEWGFQVAFGIQFRVW